MDVNTLLAGPQAVCLEFIRAEARLITLIIRRLASQAPCPDCQHLADRIHSRYIRTLADLPWHGVAVRVELYTRQCFSKRQGCPRRIFCERLPQVVAPYARKTLRLNQALTLIGFALGGKAGARLAMKLALTVSPDTLLRHVRGFAFQQRPIPRVLGVDVWAFRRSHRYGTILVDLEQRRVVDLLADRESEILALWLKQHSGVEIISRDRSSSYAEGARVGAPNAAQVADRWHLLKNLTEAVERMLNNRQGAVRQAAEIVLNSQISAAVLNAGPTTMLSSRNGQQSSQSRARRFARYCKVVELRQPSIAMHVIAKMLKMSRMTVRGYLEADGFPERAPPRSRHSPLEKYLLYLHQRFAEGCDNATQLWREVVEQGYQRKAAMVRRYVRRLCDRTKSLTPKQRLEIKTTSNFKSPSNRRAAWWWLTDHDDLTVEEQSFVDHLIRLCPEAGKIKALAGDFKRLVKERKAEEFEQWRTAVAESQIVEFQTFSEGLNKDREAVMAALRLPWSNGQTEGQVNRLKMIKRQMYGRANLKSA